MNKTKSIRAERRPWNRGVEISISVPHGNESKVAVAKPLVMEVADQGEFFEPAIRLEPTEAQELMDELWHCGIRPSEGTGSAGSLAATEKHLADMRRITFGLLKNEGVE